MTDATVEQQGEAKRRREHREVPQAADSRSSSSDSSTDTEMGLGRIPLHAKKGAFVLRTWEPLRTNRRRVSVGGEPLERAEHQAE